MFGEVVKKFSQPHDNHGVRPETRNCQERKNDNVLKVALVVKNQPAKAGDIRDAGSIPGLGRCLRVGNGNPVQYPCLGNPMDRRAWQATVRGVANSWTRLKQLNTHVGQ